MVQHGVGVIYRIQRQSVLRFMSPLNFEILYFGLSRSQQLFHYESYLQQFTDKRNLPSCCVFLAHRTLTSSALQPRPDDAAVLVVHNNSTAPRTETGLTHTLQAVLEYRASAILVHTFGRAERGARKRSNRKVWTRGQFSF